MAIKLYDFCTIVVMSGVSVHDPIYKVAIRYTQYILLGGTTSAVMNCVHCACPNRQAVGRTYIVSRTIHKDGPNSDTLHLVKGLVVRIKGCPDLGPV